MQDHDRKLIDAEFGGNRIKCEKHSWKIIQDRGVGRVVFFCECASERPYTRSIV